MPDSLRVHVYRTAIYDQHAGTDVTSCQSFGRVRQPARVGVGCSTRSGGPDDAAGRRTARDCKLLSPLCCGTLVAIRCSAGRSRAIAKPGLLADNGRVAGGRCLISGNQWVISGASLQDWNLVSAIQQSLTCSAAVLLNLVLNAIQAMPWGRRNHAAYAPGGWFRTPHDSCISVLPRANKSSTKIQLSTPGSLHRLLEAIPFLIQLFGVHSLRARRMCGQEECNSFGRAYCDCVANRGGRAIRARQTDCHGSRL